MSWRVLWIRAQIVLGGLALLGLFIALAAFPPPYGDNVAGEVVWVALGIAPIFLLGAYVAHRRPDHPQARRLLLAGSAEAVSEVVLYALITADRSWWWLPAAVLYQWLVMVTVAAIATVLALYPDGMPQRRWHAVFVRTVWWTAGLLPLLLLLTRDHLVNYTWMRVTSAPPSPLFVPWLSWLGPPVEFLFQFSVLAIAGFVVLAVRYANAPGELRRRMRVMFAAVLIGIAGVLGDMVFQLAGVESTLFSAWYLIAALLIPAAIVVGIVQDRLFDIDLVIRRSVVYALLSAGIAAAYIMLAVGPGLAFGRNIPVEIAVLMTIVAAIAFHPLRRWLNSCADRLVFGERINRYQLLTDFGTDLDRSVELNDLLPTLATTVARGLRSSWVRVSLRRADGEGWLAAPVGIAGDPNGPPAMVQNMERGGELVSRIECGPAPEAYTAEDRQLLATLAGQAGAAISNARLTAQLAEQLEELQRSRARIVSAQDAERRRIERDIHDGVQQAVVALVLKLGLAKSRIARGDTSPDTALTELQGDTGELLSELRELARGIRPPVLSDRGLVAALEARVAKFPLAVDVRTDRSLRDLRLGADVEAAAYFLVNEALTNAAKHSAASVVEVHLALADDVLRVSVHDNGSWSGENGSIGKPRMPMVVGQSGSGIGLINLRDRVEALGGTLTVITEPGHGTSVNARLPLADDLPDSGATASGSTGRTAEPAAPQGVSVAGSAPGDTDLGQRGSGAVDGRSETAPLTGAPS